jgi:hypothetical protein
VEDLAVWVGSANGAREGAVGHICARIGKVQKYGRLCDHPMGKLKGKTKRGSDKPSGGSTTASSKAACWLSRTLE